ncbi:MAG: tripartite tricarboxylate transporter substrate binding protein [Polaromonas sp.]|nr:tripartite tricarboxylate transporter substrate binding protein [Polaromonas sp.]
MKKHLGALLAAGVSLAGLATLSTTVHAQAFPSQPVRLISPFPAGSGPDAIARIVGERLTAVWKQPVIVDVRPGANGFIAINAVKQAAPTGYDLLLADVGHLAVSPSLFKKLPYNPKTDFVPVGGIYRTSFFVVVGANSPIHSVKDLVAAAATPGKITYGSNSVGGPLHLGAAQVEAATGTSMLHVPFKETSQIYTAVSTGEVDWAMGSIASAGPLMRAGKVRFVAIADDKRSSVLPDVPTFLESGGAKPVQARTWVALMAPKGTPPAVVAMLNKSLNDVLATPEVVQKFNTFGFLPDPTTPAELTSVLNKDTEVYAEMVKRTGASVD